MSQQLLLSPALLEYLEGVSLREPELLRQLRQETAGLAGHEMQIGPVQGQFMGFLVALLGARRVLEVGTYTGYSALWMALNLAPGGRLDSCDIDPVATEVARRYWRAAGIEERIELHLGPALNTLERLRERGETYDLAFLDADKENLQAYFELALDLLRPGGLILVDNVLWSGRVMDANVSDGWTGCIRQFNRAVHDDPRVDLSMLPLGDGLTLARKR
jgi:caffeoyl-CoA O-methyltransferase